MTQAPSLACVQCGQMALRCIPAGKPDAGQPLCEACRYSDQRKSPHPSPFAEPTATPARRSKAGKRQPAPASPAPRATQAAREAPPARSMNASAEHGSAAMKRPKVPPLISLDALESKPIAWLWPGWIPAGMLSICDGLPGEGKSTMLVDIAARVTTGREMPDGSPGVEPGGVLYLGFEDDPERTVRPRFLAAGADLSRVTVHHPEADDVFRLGKSPLEQWINERSAKLVVIDPLITAVLGGVDMHKGQDARRVLTPLVRIAARTRAAIIGVRHFNKGEGRSALLRGEGSIGIAGTARSVFMVARDPDDPDGRVLARSKGNLGAPPTSRRFALVGHPDHPNVSRIDWRGESKRRADDLTGPADDEHRGALEEAIEFLRVELADGPKPTRDVLGAAKLAGISERTLRRSRKELGVRPHRSAGCWVLALPPAAGPGDAAA